jgi:hypothetical protein
MSNKLAQRYYEIETDLQAIQAMMTGYIAVEVIQERLAELEVKRADLKKTVLHLIAFSKIRDEAWRALSHGQGVH